MNTDDAIPIDVDDEMQTDEHLIEGLEVRDDGQAIAHADPFSKEVVLVYKHSGYFVELLGNDPGVLRLLLTDPTIAQALTKNDYDLPITKLNPIGEPKDEPEEIDVKSFAIRMDAVNQVKERAIELGYALAEEYDFKSDTTAPNLPQIDLKPHAQIRTYQATALSHMLGSGRARSGVIVLPCGAGKTFTGVTAAHTIKKTVLCLTANSLSVRQWKEQFHHWTTIPDSHVTIFTSDNKCKNLPENGILISTFQMVAFRGERNPETQPIMDLIQSRQWGLLLVDEAHMVPAKEWRKAVQSIQAKCKLGLTATMVREDDKIKDLDTLIGPELYRADWKELTAQGYLANVQCIEVLCPMPASFMKAYTDEPNVHRKLSLSGVNPCKLRAVEMLVRYHEQRGDKIIVFSDKLFPLQTCAEMLKRPYIYGQTKEWERQLCLDAFRKDNLEVQTICLSKVGDVAIDLPKANVVIQVTSHFKSQRQEAQRLGRILRPKSTNNSSASFDAFFYTLVSKDTKEMECSSGRQKFLVDQGYSFSVNENVCEHAYSLAVPEKYAYATAKAEHELLVATMKDMEK